MQEALPEREGEMNHTPGPWIFKDDSKIVDKDDGLVMLLDNYWWPSKEQIATRTADAQLMASAPELLEALQRLVLAFDVGDMKHTTLNGRGYAALDESRKAIATASPPETA